MNKPWRQGVLDLESLMGKYGCMKTTIDIPEQTLREAMRFTGARTKREAVVTAVTDFNRRQRIARLTRHLGSCRNLMTHSELKRLRERE